VAIKKANYRTRHCKSFCFKVCVCVCVCGVWCVVCGTGHVKAGRRLWFVGQEGAMFDTH